MHMKDCLRCKQEAPKHMLKNIAEAAARKAAKAVKSNGPAQTGKGTEPQDNSAEEPKIDPEVQLRLCKNQEKLAATHPTDFSVGMPEYIKQQVAYWSEKVKVLKPPQAQYQAAVDSKMRAQKLLEKALAEETEKKVAWEKAADAVEEQHTAFVEAVNREKKVLELLTESTKKVASQEEQVREALALLVSTVDQNPVYSGLKQQLEALQQVHAADTVRIEQQRKTAEELAKLAKEQAETQKKQQEMAAKAAEEKAQKEELDRLAKVKKEAEALQQEEQKQRILLQKERDEMLLADAARVGGSSSEAGSRDVSMEAEDPEKVAAAKRKAEEVRTEGAAGDDSEGASTPKAAASSAEAGTPSGMSPMEVQQRAKEENDRQERELHRKATEVVAKRARTRKDVVQEVDLEDNTNVEEE